MARIYRIGKHHIGYNFELCEERYFLACYHEIEPRIPPTAQWHRTFVDNFYRHGNGVSDSAIDAINAERRRLGMEVMEFSETDIYDYARNTDRMWRSQQRQSMRDQYLKLDTANRVRWRDTAHDEMQHLPPPHRTLQEIEAEQREREEAINRQVLERRQRALEAARASDAEAQKQLVLPGKDDQPDRPDVSPHSEQINRFRRLFALASKEETIERLLSKLTVEQALEIAEDSEDAELRDRLVNRILDADEG